jgi:O-antigen biosynthesis protein
MRISMAAIKNALEALLMLQDEAFVRGAYQLILGRKADAEGLRHYLQRLRQGVGKLNILEQLRFSKEGKARLLCAPDRNRVAWLGGAARMPLIRSLFGSRRKGIVKWLEAVEIHSAARRKSMAYVNNEAPQFRRLDETERAVLKASADSWPRKPLISILMPVYNAREKWLRDALDSVIAQVYPEWELCVADDASTEEHVRLVLDAYQKRDSRIRVTYRAVNGHISTASNTALSIATGDYIVLFDHDDLLESQALHRVAQAIVEERPDIVYSDELLISAEEGKVIGHSFRPAFSPELLRAHPYIVHLAAFRSDLIRGVGGFDESLRISQDYDLILRCTEQAKHIVHLPEALYRWRQYEGSAGHKGKDSVMAVSKKILADHLARCGEEADIQYGAAFNYFEVRYPLKSSLRVAIIIPTRNHGELVRKCLDSLESTIADVAYDIVVIDHASDDPSSLAYFKEIGNRHTVLRYEGTFNFSAINNWAVRQLSKAYSHYLLCNNDIQAIKSGWLERMLELGQKPDIGIVGAKLYYPDGLTIQHAGVCVGMFGIAEHYGKFMDKNLPDKDAAHPGYIGSLIANHEMSAVTAACMLVRRDAFEWIGGFDEHAEVGFGDVDLCLRACYRVVFCPHAELIHHESASRGKSATDAHPEDSRYFLGRWQGVIERGDPYYNPNLTLNGTAWELKGSEECDVHNGRMEKRRSVYKHPAFSPAFYDKRQKDA